MPEPAEPSAPPCAASSASPSSGRRRLVLALACAWLWVSPLRAETVLGLAAMGADAIRQAAPSVEFALDDGRIAVLAGIHVPAEMATRVAGVLAPLLASGRLTAAVPPLHDRHGRLQVETLAPDGRSLQVALLEAGLALVRPSPDNTDAALASLFAAEASAERQGNGIWRDRTLIVVDSAPAMAGERLGRFSLIEGVVLQASAQQRYFYLNFGPNWRSDTTARIDRDALRAMRRAGFDPATLEDRRIRVRGTPFAENGPMIELWTHHAIEVLP